MELVYQVLIGYFIGFFVCLTFLKFFGERVGMGGYDGVEDNGWLDDWESNNQAFIGFSTAWFMVMPILLVIGIFKLLYKISDWYLKL